MVAADQKAMREAIAKLTYRCAVCNHPMPKWRRRLGTCSTTCGTIRKEADRDRARLPELTDELDEAQDDPNERPTQDEIAEATFRIREMWTEDDYRQRSGKAESYL